MKQSPKKLPPIIGLLGGVASGKSSVAAQFAKLGCEVVDADRIAHELLLEPKVRRAVRERFGPTVMTRTGMINRLRLGERVFSHPQDLEALEAILHPETCRRAEKALAAARRKAVPAVILDAPLILEKGLDRLCDFLVYIRAPEQVRRSRAGQTRGWNPSEVARREATQVSLKTKQNRADYTIDNSTSPEHAFEQIQTILSQLAK
ncbi:MAG: dephospho-CoA kinase [Planctomycetota bacterium]|nr:dephospho-CoA kinase [Planctomycetota bacterium]